MAWTGPTTRVGDLDERGFAIDVDGRRVPGVYFTPTSGTDDALVLLGHGGTSHRREEYIVDMARLLAERGVATMAIDAPGHGERAEASGAGFDFERTWSDGGGALTIAGEWRAALDFIEHDDNAGARPVAWWGLSMGTMMGLPVAATDHRVVAAVLGLMGPWGPAKADLVELAPTLTCPVLFLAQWDDEIVPVAAATELFGMIGSKRKTMHVNPGLHSAVPNFEAVHSADWLRRQLDKALAATP